MKTVSLLDQYPTSHARIVEGTANEVHLGQGSVGGVTRDYLFTHPPAAVEFTLPGDALRFSAGVAIHPHVWDEGEVGSCEFRVLVDGELVFQQYVAPRQQHWKEIAVELPQKTAGTRTLTLTAVAEGPGGYHWAIWSDPLVTLYVDAYAPGVHDDAAARPAGGRYPMLLPAETRFVFLAGTMKSGTTWLMKLLNAHPDVMSQGEIHPLEILDTSFPGQHPPPTLESVIAGMQSLRDWWRAPGNAWHHDAPGADAYDYQEMTRDAVRFFYEWSLLRYSRGRGAPPAAVYADKSPSHTSLLMRKIKHYFEVYRPYVIHLVRDPRDVAVSRWFRVRQQMVQGDSRNAGKFKDDADREHAARLLADAENFAGSGEPFFNKPMTLPDLFREWLAVNDSLSTEGPSVCGARYRCVRYEDLKSDLRETLRSLFSLIGVDSSDAVLTDVMDRCDISSERRAPVSEVFRKGAVGEWATYFAPADMEYFETRVRPVSEAYGYV